MPENNSSRIDQKRARAFLLDELHSSILSRTDSRDLQPRVPGLDRGDSEWQLDRPPTLEEQLAYAVREGELALNRLAKGPRNTKRGQLFNRDLELRRRSLSMDAIAGRIYWLLGKREEALESYRHAARLVDTFGLHREDQQYLRLENWEFVYHPFGKILSHNGNYSEAMDLYEGVVNAAKELLKNDPLGSPAYYWVIGNEAIGDVLIEQHLYLDGTRAYNSAIQCRDNITGRKRFDRVERVALGRIYNKMGGAFVAQDLGNEAIAAFDEAASLFQRTEVDPYVQVSLGKTYRKKGLAHEYLAQETEAKASYDLSLEAYTTALDSYKRRVEHYRRQLALEQLRLAQTQIDIGHLHATGAHFALAYNSYREALAIYQAVTDCSKELNSRWKLLGLLEAEKLLGDLFYDSDNARDAQTSYWAAQWMVDRLPGLAIDDSRWAKSQEEQIRANLKNVELSSGEGGEAIGLPGRELSALFSFHCTRLDLLDRTLYTDDQKLSLFDVKFRRRDIVSELPETPPRMWPGRPRGRPRGVSGDEALFAFIRDTYSFYFDEFRDQLRGYIHRHDPALYRAIENYERYGRRLPADIAMPSERDIAAARLAKALREGVGGLTEPERATVRKKLWRRERTQLKR